MIKTEYSIPSAVNLTIGLVADLHEYNPAEVLRILSEVKPDVIAVAGDTLERHQDVDCPDGGEVMPGESRAARWLTGLGMRAAKRLGSFRRQEKRDTRKEYGYRFLWDAGKIAPVVMCLGNHELYLTDEDREVIRAAGVFLLDNSTVEIGGVLFGGLTSGQVTGRIDKEFLTGFSAAEGFKVLLCHHPEYYPQLSKYPVDLILSGHCHGGQIRVCGRGVFAPGQGLFPKYHHGVYDGRLVVSSGCANTTSIPRWGNETEVVIVRLTAESR